MESVPSSLLLTVVDSDLIPPRYSYLTSFLCFAYHNTWSIVWHKFFYIKTIKEYVFMYSSVFANKFFIVELLATAPFSRIDTQLPWAVWFILSCGIKGRISYLHTYVTLLCHLLQSLSIVAWHTWAAMALEAVNPGLSPKVDWFNIFPQPRWLGTPWWVSHTTGPAWPGWAWFAKIWV